MIIGFDRLGYKKFPWEDTMLFSTSGLGTLENIAVPQSFTHFT